MAHVAADDLGEDFARLLDRAQAGEPITITVNGRPVAKLHRVSDRPRWISARGFLRRVAARQADPALADDLATLVDS